MPLRPATKLSTAVLLLVSAGGTSLWMHHLRIEEASKAAANEAAFPHRMLWVWERPENLRTIDTSSTGVAVLEETLQLGSEVVRTPRRQPMLLPAGVTRISVVRIETERFRGHENDRRLLQDAVAELQRIAAQPGTAALQIDFDARKSERQFYRRLIEELRGRMPEGMPLEMTALISWCSSDDWIADLPVNAAIPMFFRMEPDRKRLDTREAREYSLREPLCAGSAGVSTAEPWPQDISRKRVFIFSERGWKDDMTTVESAVDTELARR